MKTSDLEATLIFELSAVGISKPLVEFRFHETRRWRFDLAWPIRKVAVEIEGGSWSGGRHSGGAGFTEDCVKYNEAAILGWKVLRVTSNMIRDGRALEQIERALK